MSYTEAALRGCGTLDTLLNIGKVGLQLANNPMVREGAMAFLSGFKGGRELPSTEEERQLIISELRRKYKNTLKHYARFRAEYPYTVAKAAEIRERRAASQLEREARRRASSAASRRRSTDDSDIIYPEGLQPAQPRRRARRRSVDLGDVIAPPPRARHAPNRYS